MSIFQKLHTLIKIHKIIKPNPIVLFTNLILCIFHYWLVILKGRYDGILIDTIVGNNSHDKLNAIIFYIIFYYLVCNLLQKLRDTFNTQLSEYITSQIKKIVHKTQSTNSINLEEIQSNLLCNSSSDQLISPFYDIVRLIMTSYVMYSISSTLFLLIICLTPIKILAGFQRGLAGLNELQEQSFLDQAAQKEKVVQQSNWKAEFGRGLLDKIIQVIVVYFTGVKFINHELNIEELVIFSSQLMTFNGLLPAVKLDFEGLGKSLAMFEKFFEGVEAVDQAGDEASPGIYQEKPKDLSINILGKYVRLLRKRIIELLGRIKMKIFKKKMEKVSEDVLESGSEKESDGQEQGYLITSEKDLSKEKREGLVKDIRKKIRNLMNKRKNRSKGI